MSNKVLANFKDKNTKKVYRKGDSYSNDDEKRIAFLIEKGFLEKPKVKKKQNKKEG